MIIIENQFEGKPTYIVGTLIKNGCQTFNINQLDRVCERWDVPSALRCEVLNLYEENSKTEEDWEALALSEDDDIRGLVARHGMCLDILVSDTSPSVRTAVAGKGYGLDILVKDTALSVRVAVASQGYGLDVLVHDEDFVVRLKVAEQGYGLDILINDDHWVVREAVATAGYGLDKLINDPSSFVRLKAALVQKISISLTYN